MSKESLELLTRGTEEIIPEESFLEQIKSKRKLFNLKIKSIIKSTLLIEYDFLVYFS